MTRARLLVVDEDVEAKVLATDLGAHGFDVTIAGGTRNAAEAMAGARYDVALAGIQGARGAELLSVLKEADPQMAVVAVGCSRDAIRDLVRAGAFACVAKPYSLPALRALLDSAVQAKSRLQSCVTLYEVSRLLLRALKQDDLVRLIIDLSDQVLPSDGVALLLLGPATTAGFECHSSLGAREVARPLVLCLAERARTAGRMVALPSPTQDLPPGSAEAGITSAIAYPLQGPDGPLGALMFFRRGASPRFGTPEVDRGSVFAQQVSLSLENARLYREVEEKMALLVHGQERAKLRERLAGVGSVVRIVAHEVNNPLAALSCNLAALRSYSSGFGDLWQAAKAAAEFLRDQAEPTGQRLSANILAAAGGEARTDHLVTEVVAAIDECLDGVGRIAEFVRTLHDSDAIGASGDAEDVRLDDAIASLLAARTGTRRELVHQADVEQVATTSRSDLSVALAHVARALDRGAAAADPPAITIGTAVRDGRPAIFFTDPGLDLSGSQGQGHVRESGLGMGLGRRVAFDCALAVASRLLERNGGELAAESFEPRGTRLWLTLRAGAA